MAMSSDSSTCGICLKLYSDPRMLPCLHTFCSNCLEEISNKRKCETSLKCPTCEVSVVLPKGGVSAVQKDVRRSHMAHASRITCIMQSKGTKMCELCTDRNAGPAISFCHDCDCFLCKPCSNYHKLCRIFQDHRIVFIRTSKSKKVEAMSMVHKPINCQLHEDEILKFYCETCSSLICRDCMTIEHNGHNCNRFEKVYEKEKAELQAFLHDVDVSSIRVNLDNAIVKGDKVIRRFQKNQTAIEKQIVHSFTQLENSLQKRKGVLLKKVSSLKADMAMQKERFSTLRMELTSVYDMILTATQSCNPDEMLSVKAVMIRRLEHLMSQYEIVAKEPCVSDMVSCKLDTSTLIRSLKSFGVVCFGSFPGMAENDFYFCRAVAGKEMKINITTYDIHGKRFPYGGEWVKVILSGTDNSSNVIGQVVDNNDGTYMASFTPKHCDACRLSITFDGLHIKGSPFDVHVTNPRDYNQNPQTGWILQQNYSYRQHFAVKPVGVAADNSGGIYVIFEGSGFIDVNDHIGSNRSIKMTEPCSPSAIAVHEDTLYVADNCTHQVQMLSLSGEVMSTFGSYGSGKGELNFPSGLCVHKDGRIFVSDSLNNRISVFNHDGSFLYHMGGGDAHCPRIANPMGLAFDNHGKLHVCTSDGNIQMFTTQGQYVGEYYNCRIHSIAIDGNGTTFALSEHKLFILDSDHNVVHSCDVFATAITISSVGSIYLCGYNKNYCNQQQAVIMTL